MVMDTSTALHQLRTISTDLLDLHTDCLALDATSVAHKAWQAREAVRQARMLLVELDAACTAWEDADAATEPAETLGGRPVFTSS